MVNPATSVAVNNDHVGINCLSSFHYSCNLGKKATCLFDPRVLLNCKGKTALGIARDAGIVAFIMWIKGSRGIGHTILSWGMLGIGETVVSFF